MPNWCTNRWSISCETEDEANTISALMTFADGAEDPGAVTFTKLLPMPALLQRTGSGLARIDGQEARTWIEDTDADGQRVMRFPTEAEAAELAAIGYDTWYDWALATWGCKWDASHSDIDTGDRWIELRFDTAWCPPEGVLAALRARFPDAHVSAFFDEPGMEAAGYL